MVVTTYPFLAAGGQELLPGRAPESFTFMAFTLYDRHCSACRSLKVCLGGEVIKGDLFLYLTLTKS